MLVFTHQLCVDVPPGFGVHWCGNWWGTNHFSVKIVSILCTPPLCAPNWCHVVLKLVYLWDKGLKNAHFGVKMTIFGAKMTIFGHILAMFWYILIIFLMSKTNTCSGVGYILGI